MTEGQSLFRSFFDMNGTASRKRGWLVFGVTLALMLAILFIAGATPELKRWLLPLIGVLVAVQIITLVQRLHDAGRSGYWVIFALIPMLGLIAGIIINCLPSRPGWFSAAMAHIRAQRLGYLGLGTLSLLCLSRFFGEPFWVPSGSMKPTLLVGDYLLVPYVTARDVKRGDVLIFRHPVQDTDFIKRLIGLPGDTVQMQNGKILLNGAKVAQVDAGEFAEVYDRQGASGHLPRCQNEAPIIGEACLKAMTQETLPGGRSYNVLDIDLNGIADNTDVLTVPVGHYFFVGDNRDNSVDSRFDKTSGGIGFVPAENLIGRVSRILFSSAGASLLEISTWRPSRYWKLVE